MQQILVVEDDSALREALAQVLTDEGYDLLSARDGLEAVNCLKKGHRPAILRLHRVALTIPQRARPAGPSLTERQHDSQKSFSEDRGCVLRHNLKERCGCSSSRRSRRSFRACGRSTACPSTL